MVELADMRDLGSRAVTGVRVRAPLPVPYYNLGGDKMLWEKRGQEVYNDVATAILSISGQTEQELLSPTPCPSESVVGIPEAAKAIFRSRVENRHAYIIGDYDADGITSTAILSRLFTFLHIEHTTIIPRRLSDGYGVSEAHIGGIKDSLIVTVDNGITAGAVLNAAKLERGNTVVVIDHHLPGDDIPQYADAIVDPHLEPARNGFTEYCGAGLAYKLAAYMLKDIKPPAHLHNNLVLLAGIGTVADSMPLIGDNRCMVREALRIANDPLNTISPGLSCLLEVCGGYGAITASTIGYKLAPLLNAPGRMYDAGGTSALKILVCDDPEQCRAYVSKMVAINQKRRETVEHYIDEACRVAQEQASPIVVYIPNLQEGLLGVVAGRLLDTFCSTAVVLSNSRYGDAVKGSVRTAPGVHAKEMLDSVRYLLMTYGGHEGAAGLMLREKNVAEFTDRVKDYSSGTSVGRRLLYDVEISGSEVASSMAALNKFEPLGHGVYSPMCVVRDVRVQDILYIGTDKSTVKLVCDGFSVIGFGKADLYRKYGEPMALDVLGTISENHFRGNVTVQIVAEDFRPCIF